MFGLDELEKEEGGREVSMTKFMAICLTFCGFPSRQKEMKPRAVYQMQLN